MALIWSNFHFKIFDLLIYLERTCIFKLSFVFCNEHVLLLSFNYQAGSGVCLSKTKLLRCLLEGTAGANAESLGDEEKDESDGSTYDYSAGTIFCNLMLPTSYNQLFVDYVLTIYFRISELVSAVVLKVQTYSQYVFY